MNNRKYELAREIFLKRSGTEYLSDKTLIHFQAVAQTSIKLAELFIDEFKAHEKSGKKEAEDESK